MKSVDMHNRIVLKYLKKTGRLKTLQELKKSLDRKQKKNDRKPVKLSFVIQKAPDREKIQALLSLPKKLHPKVQKESEEKKTVVIPDKFITISEKFGLPKDHLEFFYTNRKSFHWESKKFASIIHCTVTGCKHTVKMSPRCLFDHMITVHNYTDIGCDKTDCSYLAYSLKNLNHHKARFHGHGRKPTEFANHTCPYPPAKWGIHYSVCPTPPRMGSQAGNAGDEQTHARLPSSY